VRTALAGDARDLYRAPRMDERRTLQLDGELALRLQGAGDTILFVQGVGAHGDAWQPQTSALADRFRCLSYDHRGLGRSTAPRTPVTVAAMADDALALLDAAAAARAHVVGHSLGGLVAQQLALQAPQRVRSLALLCTFANGRDAAKSPRMIWLGARSRLGTARMRRRAFLRIVMPDAFLATRDADALAAELAPVFGHDLGVQPPVVGQQLRALRACNLQVRLHAVRVPTLVLSAEHDLIAPPRLGRALAAAIPGARYVQIDGAAHGVPLQCPQQVNTLLREHLDACC